MNITAEIQNSKPWYKQPWLWFVMSVPIASVILSSIMVTVAIVGRDTLVDDNYYKDGLGINRTLDQDLLADTLKLRPVFTLNNTHISVKLESSDQTIPSQAFLYLKLIHPTIADNDVFLKLLPTQGNVYTGDIPNAITGKRYLDLSDLDKTWRIHEAISLPTSNYILNSPPPVLN